MGEIFFTIFRMKYFSPHSRNFVVVLPTNLQSVFHTFQLQLSLTLFLRNKNLLDGNKIILNINFICLFICTFKNN